jgi:subtilisin family serine protease
VTELLDAQEVGAPPEWVSDALGGATGSGIRVAVLDSGWDRSIGDPRVLPGVGFVDPHDDFALAHNDDDQDVLGHGTACAGVILEVAPDARVLPVKVFGNTLETSPGTLEAALLWAIEAGVHVINVSLGTRLEGPMQRLYVACERARRAGIIVVAAAHNGNEASYPAIFEPVIGVSAARFESPYHFHYRDDDAHECEGWGVDRPVLWIGGERLVKHGTSFAAPGITGIVCLIKERHPDATLEDVREMLARFALPSPKKPRKPRKRAAAAAPPPPAESAKKPRKRAAKTADDAAPAKSSSRRKPAAPAAETIATKAPAKSRKRAGAADTAAPAKPTRRKPAAAPVEPAPESPKKPRKRAAAARKDASARKGDEPVKRKVARTRTAPSSD